MVLCKRFIAFRSTGRPLIGSLVTGKAMSFHDEIKITDKPLKADCKIQVLSENLVHVWSCGCYINPYPTAFPYGNGMVLHFYQQQESSTTKTVHKVINKGLKTYV